MKSIQTSKWQWLVTVSLCFIATAALSDEIPTQLPSVDGVIGFSETNGQTWFTAWVACPTNFAMSGILWYNNDGLIVFPSILVGTGCTDGPGSIEEMVQVEENVSGFSSNWSSVSFSEPVAATMGGLYVTFTLPEGVACSGIGEGGGPGIGYCAGTNATIGWMSRDGETWVRLHHSADFSIVPVLIPFEDGMLVKNLGEDPTSGAPPARPFLTIGPNPFNPRTDIRFGMPQDSHVKIDIYDLRGRRVIRLVDGPMLAGQHRISWTGVDGTGRGVASGVYFTHMTIGKDVLTRKMSLIR